MQTQVRNSEIELPKNSFETWVPNMESRVLRTRVCLHLYRFTLDQLNDPELVQKEVARLAVRLARSEQNIPLKLRVPSTMQPNLAQSRLGRLDSDVAGLLHRHFHFLASPRPDGIHLGLFHPTAADGEDYLSCLVTLSEFDL